MTKTVFTDSVQLLHNYAEDTNIPQIITSAWDTDFYKISMAFYYFKKHPTIKAQWQFFNRGKHSFPVNFDRELKKQIKGWKNLTFTEDGIEFLRSRCVGIDGRCYFDETFFTYLRGMRFDPDEIHIVQNDDDLEVTIDGLQHKIMFYEIMLMATIVELRNIMCGNMPNKTISEINLDNISKFMLFDKKEVGVSDFGTRRRYSKNFQHNMLLKMKEHKCCVGTSNVYFAMTLGIRHIGTSAHELITMEAALANPLVANSTYLNGWVDCFGSNLGIALTDTYGTDIFLKSFTEHHARSWSGVRHDSGCPIEFADKIIAHYKKYGIDPMTKTIVFSDGINSMEMVSAIADHCKGKINITFGIGTWLNSMKDIGSMNIVVKLVKVMLYNGKWQFAIKVSDNPAKITCIDERTIDMTLYQLGIE